MFWYNSLKGTLFPSVSVSWRDCHPHELTASDKWENAGAVRAGRAGAVEQVAGSEPAQSLSRMTTLRLSLLICKVVPTS